MDEAGLRLLVRITARFSVTLFLLAFIASALRRRWPSPFTSWLVQNRRYLGLSFATSHGVHLFVLIVLAAVYPESMRREVGIVQLVGGGIAYVFIALMAATSFNRAVRWLGPRRWALLHTVGAYYIWLIFAQSFGRRALVNPNYAPAALCVLAALLLRLWARRASSPGNA